MLAVLLGEYDLTGQIPIMVYTIASIETDGILVCFGACWSIFELVLICIRMMNNFFCPLLEKFGPLFENIAQMGSGLPRC